MTELGDLLNAICLNDSPRNSESLQFLSFLRTTLSVSDE